MKFGMTMHTVLPLVIKMSYFKLEYLAVYGRPYMGESWILDYYRFAFCTLAAFPPNHAKICGDRWKNAVDIHDRQVAQLWQRDRTTRFSVEILQLQNIPFEN